MCVHYTDKVKEQRQARDRARQREMERKRSLREAWQEAERLVREGECEDVRRKKREERVMAEQMEVIRRQVREETDRKRK